MLPREAVSPYPDPRFARRVAVVFGVTTAIAVGGAILTVLNAPVMADNQLPTITVASIEATKTIAITRDVAVAATTEEITLARLEVAGYVTRAYSAWAAHNSHECPRYLLEVNTYDPTLHAVDPWGNPYQSLCGTKQYGVSFTVRSAGPDRRFDTADDLLSSNHETGTTDRRPSPRRYIRRAAALGSRHRAGHAVARDRGRDVRAGHHAHVR